jgi:hypothetical protein
MFQLNSLQTYKIHPAVANAGMAAHAGQNHALSLGRGMTSAKAGMARREQQLLLLLTIATGDRVKTGHADLIAQEHATRLAREQLLRKLLHSFGIDRLNNQHVCHVVELDGSLAIGSFDRARDKHEVKEGLTSKQLQQCSSTSCTCRKSIHPHIRILRTEKTKEKQHIGINHPREGIWRLSFSDAPVM